jgi:hypothetical protein
MASLAEIRARLTANEGKSTQVNGGGDGAMYAHWNMNEGDSANIRFLPDGNPKNTFFWVERAMIRLPFNGVKGELDNRQTIVQVPCVEMWGDSCPVLTEVRPWYKDESLKETANKYWKKRSYLFQGFVRENPISDDSTPENPIRKFLMGPQIFNLIKSALMDPELEELPTDYLRGLDFRISKSSKGGYADYSSSKWARKESALTDAERAAIDTYGLQDLSSQLPKKPTDVELNAIREMFEASVDGKAYDPDRWGQYYRPTGMAAPTGSSTPAPTPAPTPVVSNSAPVETESAPWEDDTSASQPITTPTTSQPSAKAEDILAMIRSRQGK